MSQTLNAAIAVVGIDIGKNSFHIVSEDCMGFATATPATSSPRMCIRRSSKSGSAIRASRPRWISIRT